MFHSKVLLLAFFLLATDVFAARITYSAKYDNNGKVARTTKNAEVPDDKEQLILDNMASWSDDKYGASKSKHNIILVVNNEPAASKGKASEEVQEMVEIVAKNTKSTTVQDQVVSTNQTRSIRLVRRFDH